MPTKTPELAGIYTIEQANSDIAELRGQMQILSEAVTQTDTTVIPNTPAAGHVVYSSAGQQKYMSAADGNAYNTGQSVQVYTGGGQAVTSTSSAQLGPFLFPLAVGKYRVSGKISGTNGANPGNQAVRMIATGGLVASFCDVTSVSFNTATIAANLGVFQITTVLNNDLTSGTMTNGFTWYWWIDGLIVVSTAGSLSVQGRCIVAANTWTFNAPSYFLVQPIT